MRCIFASLALAQAEECLDETVLLQVKTKQEPMGGQDQAGTYQPPNTMPSMGDSTDYYTAATDSYADQMPSTDQYYSDGSDADHMPSSDQYYTDASAEEYPTDQYAGQEYPESTGHTEDGKGEDMEEIANVVADEFNLPVDAVSGFLDQMFPQVFDEFEMGDATFIEEVILEFCQEHGGDNCHDLAAMGTQHIIEEFHNHQEEDHHDQEEDHHDQEEDHHDQEEDHHDQEEGPHDEEEGHHHQEEAHHHQEEFHLSECEEQSTWPYWHCDDATHECVEMGDHIHMNDVHACEKVKECGPEDWDCHDKAWQSTWPVCQYPNMKTVFGDHPSGIPTVAERPDGPPDNVCMLEHHCIQHFGWDHIDNNGWGDVDSCVCEQFHGVEINREPHDSWHVGYFQDYCHPHDGHHHDAAMYSDNTEYPEDFYNSADFYTLMQRISKMAKNGMGKKFLQKSGLSRRLNGKKAVKAFLKQALMKKVLPGMSGAAWGYPAEKANSNPTKPWLSYGTSSSPTKPWR